MNFEFYNILTYIHVEVLVDMVVSNYSVTFVANCQGRSLRCCSFFMFLVPKTPPTLVVEPQNNVQNTILEKFCGSSISGTIIIVTLRCSSMSAHVL